MPYTFRDLVRSAAMGHGIPAARPLSTREPQRKRGNIAAASEAAKKVVGMGSACLDYLAQVAEWPKPDDKLRTESLETQGGGNCANALTAAARLGLHPFLVSKIGDDGIGEQILSELQEDGVDTQHVLRGANSPSPFTYIIVDRTGGTRTCIHTPSDPLELSELEPRLDHILSGAALVYFDGRLTEPAVSLARAARNAGIPVLVEAERLRPHLETLLAEADFVSTSAKFPQAWTGEAGLGDALISTLQRLPLTTWIFTTLGSRGAVLLQRVPPEEAAEQKALEDILPQLWEELDRRKADVGQNPGYTTSEGVHIREGAVVQTDAAYLLRRSDQAGSNKDAASRAEMAAAQEAQRNAASGNAAGYRMHSADASWQSSEGDKLGDPPAQVVARVFLASAANISKDAVRDTTGAGDASVGTLLYGICSGLPLPSTMKLAAIVAAAKCTGLGARTALPYADGIRKDLLA